MTRAAATGVPHEIIVVSDGSHRRHRRDLARRFILAGRPRGRIGRARRQGRGPLRRLRRGHRSGILVFADARQSWAATACPCCWRTSPTPPSGRSAATSSSRARPACWAASTSTGASRSGCADRRAGCTPASGRPGRSAPCAANCSVPSRRAPSSTTSTGRCRWSCRVTASSTTNGLRPSTGCPTDAGDEFRRKVRTLTGNFQLASRLPSALLPWRNPVWLQFVSHKLLAAGGAVGPAPARATSACCRGRCTGGVLAAGDLLPARQRRRAGWPATAASRIAGAAAAFLVLNSAAWLAFWVWLSGRTSRPGRRSSTRHRTARACPSRLGTICGLGIASSPTIRPPPCAIRSPERWSTLDAPDLGHGVHVGPVRRTGRLAVAPPSPRPLAAALPHHGPSSSARS